MLVGVRVRRSKNALLAGLGGCVCVGGGGGACVQSKTAHVSLSEGLFEPLSIGLKKINKRYDI